MNLLAIVLFPVWDSVTDPTVRWDGSSELKLLRGGAAAARQHFSSPHSRGFTHWIILSLNPSYVVMRPGCWTVSDQEGEIVLNNVAVTADWLVVTASVAIDCVWPDCRISSGATGHTKYCARRGWHRPMPRLNPISCGDPLVSPTSIHATNGLKSPSIMAGKIVTGKKSFRKCSRFGSHFIYFSWLLCRWTLTIMMKYCFWSQ